MNLKIYENNNNTVYTYLLLKELPVLGPQPYMDILSN